jgi:Large eukaryotic DNA virus major capsid protein/Major capsid protein N-terminus
LAPATGNAGANLPISGIASNLNVPLPFFFARDSGLALPTAALPYNDMRINFSFRNWGELLVLNNTAVAAPGSFGTALTASMLNGGAPVLTNVNVWANYAIVSNDERRRMGCSPRDILIEQVQTAPKQNFTPASQPTGQSYDIRFSHAIKVLFFAAVNTTNETFGDRSNYTTASAGWNSSGASPALVLPGASEVAFDPIYTVSLIYENTARLSQMGTDYFSLVNPWYSAVSIPINTGYHSYSYSLNFIAADPMGSTNYGKLTNVSIAPVPSTVAQQCSAVNGLTNAQLNALGVNTVPPLASRATGADYTQTFQFVLTAVNNNIIRVSGGALGFPVL